MNTKINVKDGKIKFRQYETYYVIVNPNGKKTPLILLHGGPGSTHTYYRILDKLAEIDDRPLIMYDQIGCGKSMVTGHPELFTHEVWLEELQNLIDKLNIKQFHLLGHSWGGMLAIYYALNIKPQNVKSYILSCTLHSAKMWAQEQARHIKMMPKHMQDAIDKAQKTNDFTDEDYKAAVDEFMERHCFTKPDENSPACLRVEKVRGIEAYNTAWGPNEFTPLGNQKDYDFTDRLHEIKEPTLIISGLMDMCTPYIAKSMHDLIENSKWELFRYSRHVPYVEENEKYIQVLKKWLNEND